MFSQIAVLPHDNIINLLELDGTLHKVSEIILGYSTKLWKRLPDIWIRKEPYQIQVQKYKSNLAVNLDCAELQFTFTIWAKNITTPIHKNHQAWPVCHLSKCNGALSVICIIENFSFVLKWIFRNSLNNWLNNNKKSKNPNILGKRVHLNSYPRQKHSSQQKLPPNTYVIASVCFIFYQESHHPFRIQARSIRGILYVYFHCIGLEKAYNIWLLAIKTLLLLHFLEPLKRTAHYKVVNYFRTGFNLPATERVARFAKSIKTRKNIVKLLKLDKKLGEFIVLLPDKG